MKTQKILFALIAFAIVLSFAFLVSAVKNESEDNISSEISDATLPAEIEPPKNWTFGQCVKEGVRMRQDCYKNCSDRQKTCAGAGTGKEAKKQCKANYKSEKGLCKTTFKAAKLECKKIKHNFFETLRYSTA